MSVQVVPLCPVCGKMIPDEPQAVGPVWMFNLRLKGAALVHRLCGLRLGLGLS